MQNRVRTLSPLEIDANLKAFYSILIWKTCDEEPPSINGSCLAKSLACNYKLLRPTRRHLYNPNANLILGMSLQRFSTDPIAYFILFFSPPRFAIPKGAPAHAINFSAAAKKHLSPFIVLTFRPLAITLSSDSLMGHRITISY